MSSHHAKVLIIGSGPAGYTASIYASRAMLEPVIISGMDLGGQLTITESVENYPGFASPIQGKWLMEQMRLQAENVGARIIRDTVHSVSLEQRPFFIKTELDEIWHAESLIVATGSKVKWIGLESERIFRGFGVSSCATCDGFFYRDKEVIVIGGGNTAVEEALHLSKIARKVTLVHRRSSLRSEKILQDRLFACSNIEFLWNTEVVEILGLVPKPPLVPSVSGVRLHCKDDDTILERRIDGVFIAIGYKPNTDIFRNKLKLTDTGYIWTRPGSVETSVPGVFVAGDVADDHYRQAITSAAMGCMAALEMERYLSVS
ncbi:thioredoxin-disulfide reductase [Candidatus Liberibacter sp.]|uniref:thioredoxin-disulfide reductase n=1 Tax=Candidatus Liberibacter sp. TaxID=34022 RepID=UPI0015F52E34|nr:thioredoxin-disulfide reductase [Candidatus Liberibacter sp.]MBA5724543.1 thioredoxin-disulfide reductase [Candidatus Liberibacter sp.]